MIILQPYSKYHKHCTWWASLNNLAINLFFLYKFRFKSAKFTDCEVWQSVGLTTQTSRLPCHWHVRRYGGVFYFFLTNRPNREYTKTPDMLGSARTYSYLQKKNLLAILYLRKRSSIDKYSSSYQWKGKHLNPNLTACSPLIPIIWKGIKVKFRELANLKCLNLEDGYAVQEQIRWHFLN